MAAPGLDSLVLRPRQGLLLQNAQGRQQHGGGAHLPSSLYTEPPLWAGSLLHSLAFPTSAKSTPSTLTTDKKTAESGNADRLCPQPCPPQQGAKWEAWPAGLQGRTVPHEVRQTGRERGPPLSALAGRETRPGQRIGCHPLRKTDFPTPRAKRSGGWDKRWGAHCRGAYLPSPSRPATACHCPSTPVPLVGWGPRRHSSPNPGGYDGTCLALGSPLCAKGPRDSPFSNEKTCHLFVDRNLLLRLGVGVGWAFRGSENMQRLSLAPVTGSWVCVCV